MFWKRKRVPNSEQQQLIDIVNLLCQKESCEVRVDPENFSDYFISDSELHYDVLIDSIGIHITNTNHTITERLEDWLLDELKTIAKSRAHKDRQILKDEILRRKNNMLFNMKNSLRKNE